MDYKNQILLLTEFLQQENFDYALIGAFALQAYGYSRLTKDVDFITRLQYQERIIGYLESMDFETINRTDVFTNHLYPAGSIRFDFLYVDGETADSIFNSLKVKILFNELKIPVASPEHLVALKLFAASADPERKFKELADIKELIKITNIEPDKIEKYFIKYNLEKYFDEIKRKNK
ncbi:MAG: nucleotidyl transferase AbiEii/AbiGii toxin family protein [Calditrichaceae bacterium]|jgi:hypothetical protein